MAQKLDYGLRRRSRSRSRSPTSPIRERSPPRMTGQPVSPSKGNPKSLKTSDYYSKKIRPPYNKEAAPYMSNKEKKRQEYYLKKALMKGQPYYKDFKPKSYQRDFDEHYRKSSDSMHHRDSKSSKYGHHHGGQPYHQSSYHESSSSKDHGHHSHLSRYDSHLDTGPPAKSYHGHHQDDYDDYRTNKYGDRYSKTKPASKHPKDAKYIKKPVKKQQSYYQNDHKYQQSHNSPPKSNKRTYPEASSQRSQAFTRQPSIVRHSYYDMSRDSPPGGGNNNEPMNEPNHDRQERSEHFAPNAAPGRSPPPQPHHEGSSGATRHHRNAQYEAQGGS